MSEVSIPEKPLTSSSKGTSIGKLVRSGRRRIAGVAGLLSFVSAIVATAFVYLASTADIQARYAMQIAAAAFASVAVVLLFRSLDGRFAIQTRRSGNWQSSSIIGVLLWIACFAALSATYVLIELRDSY
jgi:hypothetical protein